MWLSRCLVHWSPPLGFSLLKDSWMLRQISPLASSEAMQTSCQGEGLHVLRIPHIDCEVTRLEQVQKNAARLVCNNYKTSKSTSKLVKSFRLGHPPTEASSKPISAFFKLHNNLVNCNIPESVSPRRKSRSTRRYQLCYQQLHANVLSFNYSFFPRTIRLWNLHPYEVVSSDTLSCF